MKGHKIEFRVKRNIFGKIFYVRSTYQKKKKIFYVRSESLKVFDSLFIVDYDCLSLRW